MKPPLSRLSLLLCGAAPWSQLSAQDSRPQSRPDQVLPEIVVQAKTENLLGVAATASEGRVRGAWVRERALSRPGEVLESVPGVVVTQHSGAGKANQFFLRGFNLDHGTDFATRVAGIPVNLPTHAHGQGYTDLNFLIPELVDRVDFKKGPYHPEVGDFGSAGAADIDYVRSLERPYAKLEFGSYGYQRSLLAGSQRCGDGDLLAALELLHEDGPWENEQDHDRRNFLTRWTRGDAHEGWSLTASAYSAKWDATDQVPKRALAEGRIGRYGAIDASDGGESSRYALAAEMHRAGASGRTHLGAWALAYDFDLFSNFTYFLVDPVNGDQFEQKERRVAFGADFVHAFDHELLGAQTETRVGAELRTDLVGNSLSASRERTRLSTTRRDQVRQLGFGAHAASETQWTEWLRTRAGVRGDALVVDVDSDLAVNSGTRGDGVVSPKFSVVFGPWHDTEVSLSAGLGFHSNDGRGALTRDDPTTPVPDDGVRLDPLVPTRGAELGIRSMPLRGLTLSAAAWLLELDSELVFVGDAGTTEASRASRRHGVEFQAAWNGTPWLATDLDVALSRALYADRDPAGRHIPGSVQGVVSGGVTVKPSTKSAASLRGRYFGPRPLIEDDSVRSRGSMLWNARFAYTHSASSEFTLDVLNLFDAKVSDIDYFYESRLPGEAAAGVSDVHSHPAEPFGIRVAWRLSF